MTKNNLIPPYMKDQNLGLFEKYGFLKCIPCFLVTLTECAVIAGLVYGLIKIMTGGHPYLGISIIAVLCILVMTGQSLIVWKKKKNKRDDNIEKEV